MSREATTWQGFDQAPPGAAEADQARRCPRAPALYAVRVRVDPDIVQYVAIAAGAVGLLGLLVGLLALRSARRARRSVRALTAGPAAGAAPDAALRARVRRGLCHVGLIRYDALAEMGGRLSFSVAPLS